MNTDVARAIETILAHPQFQRIQARIALAETVDDEDALFAQAVEILRAAIDPVAADPAPPPSGGVSFADLIADITRTQARTLYPELRAEGRVISPRPVRSNIHE